MGGEPVEQFRLVETGSRLESKNEAETGLV